MYVTKIMHEERDYMILFLEKWLIFLDTDIKEVKIINKSNNMERWKDQ